MPDLLPTASSCQPGRHSPLRKGLRQEEKLDALLPAVTARDVKMVEAVHDALSAAVAASYVQRI